MRIRRSTDGPGVGLATLHERLVVAPIALLAELRTASIARARGHATIVPRGRLGALSRDDRIETWSWAPHATGVRGREPTAVRTPGRARRRCGPASARPPGADPQR